MQIETKTKIQFSSESLKEHVRTCYSTSKLTDTRSVEVVFDYEEPNYVSFVIRANSFKAAQSAYLNTVRNLRLIVEGYETANKIANKEKKSARETS